MSLPTNEDNAADRAKFNDATLNKRRPVPHIQHTPELEDAAIAVTNAKTSKGLAIVLCPNPLDVHQVRDSMKEVAKWTEDPAYYCADEGPDAELTACSNIILLATLLREHLKAGNS